MSSLDSLIKEFNGIHSGAIRFDRHGEKYTLVNPHQSGLRKHLCNLVNRIIQFISEVFASTKVFTSKTARQQQLLDSMTQFMKESLQEAEEGCKHSSSTAPYGGANFSLIKDRLNRLADQMSQVTVPSHLNQREFNKSLANLRSTVETLLFEE